MVPFSTPLAIFSASDKFQDCNPGSESPPVFTHLDALGCCHLALSPETSRWKQACPVCASNSILTQFPETLSSSHAFVV